MIFPFKQIAYWIREVRLLRESRTVAKYRDYVLTKLKTPENIAWWVEQTIFYDRFEHPLRWNDIASTLRKKKGNCTELSCVARYGMNLLNSYLAMNFCVYGTDKDGVNRGHAVCAFTHFNRKGYMEAGHVNYYPDNTSWETIAKKVRPDWTDISTGWKDDQGKNIVGLP